MAKLQKKSNKKARISTLSGSQEITFSVDKEDSPETMAGETEIQSSENLDTISQLVEEEKPNCTCKEYDGQSLKCVIHNSILKCPQCNCVDTLEEVPNSKMDPMIDYHCLLCGSFLRRNTETSMYLLDGKELI